MFSFKEKKISTKNAGYFFAERNIFTQKDEEFWCNNVEAPLADFFNNMSGIKVNKNIVTVDEKYIRAMHLLLLTNIQRSSWYKGKKMNDFNSDDLKKSLKKDWDGRYGLYMLDASCLSQRYKLMFPEYGVCPIVFLTKERIPISTLGVPVLGDKMLITYKRSQQDPEDIKKNAMRGDFLFRASVSNEGDKVIIHPDFLKYAGEQELSQSLIQTRSHFCQYIDLCEKLKKEINH